MDIAELDEIEQRMRSIYHLPASKQSDAEMLFIDEDVPKLIWALREHLASQG